MSGLARSWWRTEIFLVVGLLLAFPGCRFGQPIELEDRSTLIDSMYAEYREDFPGIGEILAEELIELLGTEELLLVDVREPEERAVSVIPGSITRAEFESSKDGYRDKTIVVHCTIGYRSGVYAKELASEGIEARNLAGSILSWTHAGGDVVTLDGVKTKRVHVYGATWDLLPDGFEAIW